MNSYLLSCSISANVRQSIQVKFDDLKLPASVVDTLEKNNTVSLRPNLSNALKAELDSLRVLQRELYDSYCLHFGDNHFVTSNYFEEANNLIKYIRNEANEANGKLFGLWESEHSKWQATVEGFLHPLFTDETEYALAREAYLKVFPTRQEYKNPIRVHVVGPLPVSLEVVTELAEGDIDSLIAHENSINTKEVIEAAHANAADRALHMSAELLDDLDVRTSTKIGRQQTGGDKKRGSWQITAQKLKLISDSVPGFDNLAALAESLLKAGESIQSPNRSVREDGCKLFQQTQTDIRKELETIVSTRDSSKGLEILQKSLALSSSYKTLCEQIKTADSIDALESLVSDANVELDVYAQRSKHINKIIAQRRELFDALNGTGKEQVTEGEQTQPEEADF